MAIDVNPTLFLGEISLFLSPSGLPSASVILPHCFMDLFPLPDREHLEGKLYVINMMVGKIVRMIIIILY